MCLEFVLRKLVLTDVDYEPSWVFFLFTSRIILAYCANVAGEFTASACLVNEIISCRSLTVLEGMRS